MADDGISGPWVFDDATLTALRLEKARTALERQDPHQALVEAEELLELQPTNLPALSVAGRASLEMGDACLALEIYQRLVDADPRDIDGRIGLAVSTFETARFDSCLQVAATLVERAPSRPEGWYYRALCLDRLGQPADARVAFERAHACQPDLYPLPRKVGARTLRMVLSTAMDALPGPLRAFFGSVNFVWERFPDAERLREQDPPTSPFVSVLLEGTPPAEGDPWRQRPDRALLFKDNLTWPPTDAAELSWRLRRALIHEAIIWLGVEDTEGWLDET